MSGRTEFDVLCEANVNHLRWQVDAVALRSLQALGIPPDLPAGTVEASLQCVADLVRRGYACYPITDEQAEALRRLAP